MDIALGDPGASIDYVLVNAGMEGYCRVRYSSALLDRLLATPVDDLSPAEWTGLLQDIQEESRAGQFPLDKALALIPKFSGNTDLQMTKCLVALATQFSHSVPDEPDHLAATRFIRAQFGPRAKALGLSPLPGEGEEIPQLRETLAWVEAIEGRDEALRQEATRLAQRWLGDRKAIEPGMVGTVLCIAAESGDQAQFDRFLAEAKQSKDPTEINNLMLALGSFGDRGVMEKGAAILLDPGIDAAYHWQFLWKACGNPWVAPGIFRYLAAHWDALEARWPKDLANKIPALFSGLDDAKDRQAFSAFFSPIAQRYPGGPRILDQALETIDLNIAKAGPEREQARAFLKRLAGE